VRTLVSRRDYASTRITRDSADNAGNGQFRNAIGSQRLDLAAPSLIGTMRTTTKSPILYNLFNQPNRNGCRNKRSGVIALMLRRDDVPDLRTGLRPMVGKALDPNHVLSDPHSNHYGGLEQ
jgi:hypothetical protein